MREVLSAARAAEPSAPGGAPGGAPVVARRLSRSFGEHLVVDELDLTVEADTIHGFIGPSGSGKTTTIRMLLGILRPTGGEVRVLGVDPLQMGTDRRRRIGYVPQLGVLYPHLSIGDNLRFAAALYGVRRPRRRIGEVLELLDLGGRQRLRLDRASGGMQRRVALAAALLHDPLLLFLDEPTAGLDPVLRRAVWQHLQDLRDRGRTVVVTTQIVSEAAMCDVVGLLADGSMLATGTPEALRRKAAGGDVVDLHTDRRIEAADVEELLGHPGVRSASRTGEDGQAVRVTLEDADVVTPALVDLLGARGVEVRLTERYLTPFDDVFVALVEEDGSALGDVTVGAG
jgi:ABC-2 type transport system ATP-binding protein